MNDFCVFEQIAIKSLYLTFVKAVQQQPPGALDACILTQHKNPIWYTMLYFFDFPLDLKPPLS